MVVTADSSSATKETSVFAWGDIWGKFPDRPLPGLDGVFVTQISCGGGHALILGNLRHTTPQVYAVGSGSQGQLGTGKVDSEKTPVLITGDFPAAVQVACGHEHSLIVTGQGTLYSFGLNRHGQLGLGEWTIACKRSAQHAEFFQNSLSYKPLAVADIRLCSAKTGVCGGSERTTIVS